LLDAAADGMVVRLTFYALPDVPRTDAGRRHVRGAYSGVDDLWDSHLDGLIVTGTEPKAPNLKDEPYWESLIRVLEWAEHNTHSTVWSCLAAHAALLHMDGIDRRKLSDKRFGVFECARVSDHPLMAAAPSRLPMPHSRWNDLPEDALTSSGYRVLTRSEHAGVDAFVKQTKSLFVFFQGHPEYEANTWLLEYPAAGSSVSWPSWSRWPGARGRRRLRRPVISTAVTSTLRGDNTEKPSSNTATSSALRPPTCGSPASWGWLITSSERRDRRS